MVSDQSKNGEAVTYRTENGDVAIAGNNPPLIGDEIVFSPVSEAEYMTSGSVKTPELGDEGQLVRNTNEDLVYISGGKIICDPTKTAYWSWKQSIIPEGTIPFTINTHEWDLFWSSEEFKAIKFDLWIQGYVKVWAFGVVVLDMATPLDEEGHAVPYHWVSEIYYSDNYCGARMCRLNLYPLSGRPLPSIYGEVDVLVGRKSTFNGSVASEVLNP